MLKYIFVFRKFIKKIIKSRLYFVSTLLCFLAKGNLCSGSIFYRDDKDIISVSIPF